MLCTTDISIDLKDLSIDELWDLWEQEVAAAHNLIFDSVTPIREHESFGQDIDNRWAALQDCHHNSLTPF